MTLKNREKAPPIFINPLEDAHPHEIRSMRERAGKLHMREVHRRLRESGAAVDGAVSTCADAVESALTENPSDPSLLRLNKALQRYQSDQDDAAALTNDASDPGATDDDDADADDEDADNGSDF